MRILPTLWILAILVIAFSPILSYADEKPPCKALDIREFGLVGDGVNGEPWSEVQLIEKFGAPCAVIPEGEVVLKDGYYDTYRLPSGTARATVATKKKYLYSGGSSEKTSVFTIVDGLVVKKERIY